MNWRLEVLLKLYHEMSDCLGNDFSKMGEINKDEPLYENLNS